MNSLIRRITSVRARLTLWNTVTFAIVLIALGVGFRFLARNYLLSALDREISAQAKRMQETRTVKRLMVSDNLSESNISMKFIAPEGDQLPQMSLPEHAKSVHVEVIQNVGAFVGDSSGQFQYRSFNLDGKPLSTSPPSLPAKFNMLTTGGVFMVSPQPEQYKPWDSAALKRAAAGNEVFSNLDSEGTPLRVMSLPLRDPTRIIGTAQIAAPLLPVYRDISGLTRALFLVLPPALLVAGLVGVFLTDRALRPVKALTQAATRIRPDQLEQRLPVSGADEFDELAATFNRALGRVELAFQERERMMEQLRRFTGDASHELRTPLTTIKANTSVALTDETPSNEHVFALHQIDRAADRMTCLVDDLLLLARSDAGQLPLERSIVSVYQVMREAVSLLMPAFSTSTAPPIALLCDVADEVIGDPDQLIRLFRNLLENAARYSGPEGTIVATTARKGACIEIQIADKGMGIAPQHLAHLGERFYRADSGRNRRHGGAGLGLAICRSIVTQHGGDITIDSAVGVGTTVTILLPASSQGNEQIGQDFVRTE